MIEYIGGWIEGATAASRFFARDSSGSSWFTPETIPAWAAFGAALLSAVATFQAVKISRQTIVNENRKEALRLLIETCSLYEKVSDYLSIETPVLISKLDRIPSKSHIALEKQKIKSTIKTHTEGASAQRDSHYKLLEDALHEKSSNIAKWQETLADAQMRFAQAGRAMPVVVQSLNSQIEMLDELAQKHFSTQWYRHYSYTYN